MSCGYELAHYLDIVPLRSIILLDFDMSRLFVCSLMFAGGFGLHRCDVLIVILRVIITI